ncbi:MAG: cation transporter [Gammaproteobacteria bacterium]|nr:cation transporter [Gammaproteobacteria bacterium]
METIVLNVTGMKCGGCESAVKQSLESLDGIEKAVPNHKLSKVEIAYSTTRVDVEQMKSAVETLGYKVLAE